MRRGTALALLALGVLPGCSLLRFSRDSDYTASPHFAEQQKLWPAARELRVVTFNIHDLYWLSEHRAARVREIGNVLIGQAPDVVCLQEGFVAGDVAVIADALRTIGLEHATDYPSGVLGSGLWTFSRFPIRETFFLRYSQNGAMFDTKGGDWWAGKGIGLARIEVAEGQLLDVYNTHLICGLGGPELGAHRHVQVRELAGFVVGATPPGIPAVLCGDFNCGPGSREFGFLDHALQWQPMLQHGGWLDHVYARALPGEYRFTPLDETAIEGRAPVPGEESVSLSDHTGWLVRLRIEQPAAGDPK
jgi:sphingomyelin phosphodiesterase 2